MRRQRYLQGQERSTTDSITIMPSQPQASTASSLQVPTSDSKCEPVFGTLIAEPPPSYLEVTQQQTDTNITEIRCDTLAPHVPSYSEEENHTDCSPSIEISPSSTNPESYGI